MTKVAFIVVTDFDSYSFSDENTLRSDGFEDYGWEPEDVTVYDVRGLTPVSVTVIPARVEIGVSTPELVAETADMMPVFELLEKRNPREDEPGQHHCHLHGEKVRVTSNCPNDYYSDRLPEIPAGTAILIDFSGDFGLYGTVSVNGILHRIKVNLCDVHNLDWSPFL